MVIEPYIRISLWSFWPRSKRFHSINKPCGTHRIRKIRGCLRMEETYGVSGICKDVDVTTSLGYLFQDSLILTVKKKVVPDVQRVSVCAHCSLE